MSGHNKCIKNPTSSGSLVYMTADEILRQLSHYVRRWKRASWEHGEESQIALDLKQEYEDAKAAYIEKRRQEGAS